MTSYDWTRPLEVRILLYVCGTTFGLGLIVKTTNGCFKKQRSFSVAEDKQNAACSKRCDREKMDLGNFLVALLPIVRTGHSF